MPTRNISLTPHLDKIIQRSVDSGEYGNASDVVRDALRLLHERQKAQKAKLKALRDAAKAGFDEIDRGEYTLLRGKGELKAHLDAIADRVRRENAAKSKRRA
ncbi:MAG TPA: type II toxin-antitoxin system ParD family antitoxin [Gemmataceae bacterium]|jgi:antitoxin ParD1/3/4|nr:type II toxin-antitoxin system ParD family antitoxin [Gemmataceae bacterium]